jgi:hypothetical protein
MKTWFSTSTSEAAQSLRSKYGEYPALWKQVLNWSGWKDARREYLKEQQLSEKKEDSGMAAPLKRKSRWGSADPAASVNDSNKKQSRWGNDAPQQQPLAPVLPGMQPLPVHKREEVEQLRGRLREINRIMDNVEQEAARVDNLPRGHRERSPSPPPSEYTKNVTFHSSVTT